MNEHCTGCHGKITDGPVIGVTVGTVDQYGRIENQQTDWYHMDCWTPLPRRQQATTAQSATGD